MKNNAADKLLSGMACMRGQPRLWGSMLELLPGLIHACAGVLVPPIGVMLPLLSNVSSTAAATTSDMSGGGQMSPAPAGAWSR